MFADRLKKSLLQAAIQGQLTEQLPTDGNARDLLQKIRAEKAKLIAVKKIKAEKPLPPVTDDEIPFDIPDNWCWCRLGEVCNYGTNETILPAAMKIGKLLIDLEDVEKDAGNLIKRKFFDGTNANSSKNIFRRGQVLFGKLRVYLNKVIVADADGYCSSEILPLDFGQNILNRYAQIFLMSPMFLSYANACSYGTKMPRLGTKAGQLALFPLPPLAEQERIVEKLNELLSEVDELAKDERELVELEETFPRRMRNSLLQAAIQGKLTEQLPSDGDARDLLRKIRTEKAKLLAEKKIKAEKSLPPVTDDEIPFDLPNNWCWCRLGEVCEMYTGNSIAESEKKAKYLGLTDGFSYIGTKDISFDSRIDYDNGVRIPFENNFRRAKKNSVLMCIEGGSAGKKIAVTNQDVCFGNKLCNFNSEEISNRYIYFYLQSSSFKKFFVDNVTGIIGGVSLKRLNLIPLPLPPLAEQKRIVESLEELMIINKM